MRLGCYWTMVVIALNGLTLAGCRKIGIGRESGLPVEEPAFVCLGFEETEAEFPGGVTAWQNYVAANFQWPDSTGIIDFEGTVVIDFVIDTLGNVGSVKVVSGPLEGGFREEVVRVIRNSGRWIPATWHGRPSHGYKRQPIVFKMVEESEEPIAEKIQKAMH